MQNRLTQEEIVSGKWIEYSAGGRQHDRTKTYSPILLFLSVMSSYMPMACICLGSQTDSAPNNVNKEEYVLPCGSKDAPTITVKVIGPAVQKPGIYHIKADTSFAELIKWAGLLKTSNGRVGVRRVVNGHTTTMNISVKQSNFKLFDADVFYTNEVPPVEVSKPNLTKIDNWRVQLEEFGNSLDASPWKSDEQKFRFERESYDLMKVEVRLWELKCHFRQGDVATFNEADEASEAIHEMVLQKAEEALLLLQQKPNPAFTKVIIGHLENYPFDWSQEGSETLIPDLRNILENKADAKVKY